ncbi:poly(glycerol-phosphate) alpha-glucosyltransferase [Salinibacter ruber]|uniref:glycosyltransferase n=1 Tax=Salinibacter ruber TaxID=146919 RepID=UPI002167E620|nr:glycosyltransferase [Salinibacter ruber]MCS4155842.1 poly(glycerol-phosphate) alpha-glucosyltransferase [Salinibacter ruber]
MKVAFLSPYISRAGGGLYEVERDLAHALVETTPATVEVVGLDYEYGEEEKTEWAPLEPWALSVTGPSAFGYAPDLVDTLHQTGADLLHLHSLWMYTSIATRRWAHQTGQPFIITVHGMLDEWALNNSRWKKQLAGWFYEDANLEEAACLHVFHDDEHRAVREYGVDTPVCVIPNGVALPGDTTTMAPPWEDQIPSDHQVLLFLGRIHPKKGLQELLEGWKQVRTERSEGRSWSLAIVGWDDGGHRSELEQIARESGLSSVHFLGSMFGDEKEAAFHHADAFILPSHSEGLPVAVLEAWSYGLPVIKTPACNLPEGFEENAALRVTPDPESVAAGLRRLFNISAGRRAAIGDRGRALVEERFTWSSVAEQVYDVYRWMLGDAEAPTCVRFD